jgi:hypothetical protein
MVISENVKDAIYCAKSCHLCTPTIEPYLLIWRKMSLYATCVECLQGVREKTDKQELSWVRARIVQSGRRLVMSWLNWVRFPSGPIPLCILAHSYRLGSTKFYNHCLTEDSMYEVVHWPPAGAQIKNTPRISSAHLSCLHGVVLGHMNNFTVIIKTILMAKRKKHNCICVPFSFSQFYTTVWNFDKNLLIAGIFLSSQ